MSINVRYLRQEVSKVRLSKAAFNELQSAKAKCERDARTLIDASTVYAELMAFPKVLEELKGDFYFENRGMSEQEQLFKAPILSFSDEGVPLIRYFRVYIESAHLKAGVPLTLAQTEALDFLDTVLDQSSVQHRVLLEPGQVLISADNKFLHTRTHFIDRKTPHTQINDAMSLNDLNRYMLRMWLRKK